LATLKNHVTAKRFVIVGNPENRRVGMFRAALARQEQPEPEVIAWRTLAEEGSPEALIAALPEEPTFLRIDSFGEDFDVDRLLLARGFEDARELGAWAVPPSEVRTLTYDRGRIFAPRQQHCGFLRVLGELERALARRPWLRSTSAPESIARLFDKRASAVAFAEARLPIPAPLATAETPSELRERMSEAGVSRVFVKLSCGSSASCLALYDVERPWLFTSMEVDGDRLYNSLRPRRYTDRDRIDRLLGFLLREGSHVEAAVPKARIGGQFFDTRMLVIAGEVAFTVVRKSRHPVTNLHLGGTRGTPAELASVVSESVLALAHETCRKVFALHDCLHVGIDVMFTADRSGHRVLEANAFGDLLPNLTRDGLDVYEWQIRCLLRTG
jgi:hypothetical protein